MIHYDYDLIETGQTLSIKIMKVLCLHFMFISMHMKVLFVHFMFISMHISHYYYFL